MSGLVQSIVHFLLSGLSVLLVAAILPGIRVRKYSDAVVFSIIVALLNALVWKVLGIVTIPAAILTLGVVGFFLNGAIFLVAKKVVRGVEIDGCLIASLAALLVSVCNALLDWALPYAAR
jgi:putative membrane protein